MGNRQQHHGSIGLRNGKPQANGAALHSDIANQLRQEQMIQHAQQVAQGFMNDTAKQIFAGLVVDTVPIPELGGALDGHALRCCAAFSIEAAKYLAEALGMVRLEPVKVEVEAAAGAEQPSAQTEDPEPQPESRIILPQ